MGTFLMPSPEAFQSPPEHCYRVSVCAVSVTQGFGGGYHGDGSVEARCPCQVHTAGGQLLIVAQQPLTPILTDTRITQIMWHPAKGFRA